MSSTASPATARPSGPGRVAMSAATIDRYLAPAGARAVRGRSTAKGRSRPARLHQDPQGRRARWRPSPGSSRPVTVAHCGPVLKGEFARTVNMTDVLTGWTFTRSIRNNAEKHIISALDAAVDAIPFPVLGMDFDNGSEFTGHGVVRWAGNPGHLLPPARAPTGRTTRPPSRPEKQPRGAPLRLPATATDTDAEHRVPGRLREPAQHPSQLPRPPPASPSGGALTGRAGASACTTGPAHPWTGCWTPTP